jgi:hypothetical protein
MLKAATSSKSSGQAMMMTTSHRSQLPTPQIHSRYLTIIRSSTAWEKWTSNQKRRVKATESMATECQLSRSRWKAGLFFFFYCFVFFYRPICRRVEEWVLFCQWVMLLCLNENLELFKRGIMWSDTWPITLLTCMSQLDPCNLIGRADGRVTGTDRECAMAAANKKSSFLTTSPRPFDFV